MHLPLYNPKDQPGLLQWADGRYASPSSYDFVASFFSKVPKILMIRGCILLDLGQEIAARAMVYDAWCVSAGPVSCVVWVGGKPRTMVPGVCVLAVPVLQRCLGGREASRWCLGCVSCTCSSVLSGCEGRGMGRCCVTQVGIGLKWKACSPKIARYPRCPCWRALPLAATTQVKTSHMGRCTCSYPTQDATFTHLTYVVARA